jgi:hypothetical protein
MSAWTNFSPIGAMALFAGTYFLNRPKAFITPIFVLFASDILIMNIFYPEFRNGLLYNGWYWNYGSFFLMVVVAQYLRSGSVLRSIFAGSILAALIHFSISNFGEWVVGSINLSTGLPYERSLSGLIECYRMAIPFFRNTLLSNLVFSGLLFGIFELVQFRFPALRPKAA